VPERSWLCPGLPVEVPVDWAAVAGAPVVSCAAAFAFVWSAPVIALLSLADVAVLVFVLDLRFCPRDRLLLAFFVVVLASDILEFWEVSPVF
jgi:hypothetical protein